MKLSITFYFATTLACDIRLKAQTAVSYTKTFLIITCVVVRNILFLLLKFILYKGFVKLLDNEKLNLFFGFVHTWYEF